MVKVKGHLGQGQKSHWPRSNKIWNKGRWAHINVKLLHYITADETSILAIEIKKDFEFDGYKGNKTQNNKKILRDVLKKGDVYFNSGDLFTFDEDYFVYFADRIGDTFR